MKPNLTAKMKAIRKKAAGKMLVKSLLDEMVDAASAYEKYIIKRDVHLADTLRMYPLRLLERDVKAHTGNEDEYFELKHIVKVLERKVDHEDLSDVELKDEAELRERWNRSP